MMRFSATPTAAAAFNVAFDDTDFAVLSSIAAPTQLLYRANQRRAEEVEATAAMLPLAELVELPADHWRPFLGDTEPMARAIEDFLDGIHDQERDLDRMLATVLFTDIVDSTARTAEIGDARGRHCVERHDDTVRRARRGSAAWR